jgi:RNA polymerase sigma-70 factor, ECF subfamily
MAQIADSDALQATAKQGDHIASASVWAGLPKPAFDDQHLRGEILRLIPQLKRYVRALTRDVIAADDLVQDCLARALETIHLWEPGTDLRAWLFTILYRGHISRIRRDARQRDHLELQESDSSLVISPNQTARLELRDLERGLANLPEEQRSVILLVGLEGMAHAEAAADVNIPVGTDFPPVRTQATQITGGHPMKLLPLAILACLAATPVGAQQREVGPMPQLHAVNPSMSLSVPTNNPLQEQMRQDYATELMGTQRELLQQNPSGLGRQEQAIGRELNGYTPR